MKQKTQDLIIKIIKIKVNLLFIAIFTTALVFSAEMLQQSIYLKEICFWIAIMLIMMSQVFKNISMLSDTMQE